MPKKAWNARTTLAALTLLAGAVPACSGDDVGGAPPIPVGDDGTGLPPPGTAGSSSSGSGTAADSSGSSTGGGPVANCGDLTCIGHGACEVSSEGVAFCACDAGYVLDDGGTECLVDRGCIELRYLEDLCRQRFNGPPAVSLFFALDFCAGTAVTPEWFDTLGLEMVVLDEEGTNILDSVEAEAVVINKDVESFVTIMLDMSDSVAQNQDLPSLVSSLRDMVAALEPEPGDPPVAVSLYVFGRFVEELQPFTRDLSQLDAALAAIEADPVAVAALVNGNGTSLYEAVEIGIRRTQRIRDLRAAVSWDGVLSTGTVVVVTDGNDTSNGALDSSLVSGTLNQMISIGISGDIDDADLTAIGRDGSFLAPTPADWVDAFAEIATRVDEYPDRAYLLAYCSAATEGQPVVTVTVQGPGITVKEEAGCNFNADAFGTNPDDLCDAALFQDECLGQECGGLTACGACGDDECCNGAQCMAPVIIEAGGLTCGGTDQFCAAAGEICVEGNPIDTCETPDALGGACEPGCEHGAAWCLGEGDAKVADSCEPAFGLGVSCDSPFQCQSLNCQPTNPDNPFELPTCQPEALLFDACAPSDTICEAGGYCQGSSCRPQHGNAQTCSGAVQCRSGSCAQPVQTNLCVQTSMCYWPWSDKLPG